MATAYTSFRYGNVKADAKEAGAPKLPVGSNSTATLAVQRKPTGSQQPGPLEQKAKPSELEERREKAEAEFFEQFMKGNMDPKVEGEEEMMKYITAARRAVLVMQKATEIVKQEVAESEKEAEQMMEELTRLRAELERARK